MAADAIVARLMSAYPTSTAAGLWQPARTRSCGVL